MEAALHALTSGEAKEELTLAFHELKNKAKEEWTENMWTKDLVKSYYVCMQLKETYPLTAKAPHNPSKWRDYNCYGLQL